jgi:hypothetical protein
MSTVIVPQYAQRALPTNRWMRNGRYPDASVQNLLASQANHAAKFLTKEVFSYSCPLASIPSSDDRDRWRFAWRSGPYARYLWMHVVYMANHTDPLGADAVLTVASGVSAIGTATVTYNHAPGSDTPAYLGTGDALLESAGAVVELTANTEYQGLVSDVDGRLVAISVFETSIEATTANGFVSDVQGGAPIFDEDRADVTAILRNMWKQGGAHLLNWTVDNQASPRTTTSATEANLIDTALTGGSSYGPNAPGFLIDFSNRTRLKDGGPKIEVWVYASKGTSNGIVQLVTDSSDAIAAVTISGTAAWYSIAATVDVGLFSDAANAFCHLLFSSGGGTLSVYAVSVYQFE